jgi:N-acetylmuramoyl-L-alanine amidase
MRPLHGDDPGRPTNGARLRGKRVVVDPAHGGPDRGDVCAGVAEADLMWDLACRLTGRMTAAGMDAMLSRRESTCPTDAERAAFANTVDADVLLTLHTDADRSMYAQGLATFHHEGTDTPGAAAKLAGIVHRELLTRTGMLDCRTHEGAGELMQRAAMPSVRVELGYLTNVGDRRRLMDPAFRDVVAEGLLVAVKRLYLVGFTDLPTGTFTFGDVLARELESDRDRPVSPGSARSARRGDDSAR